MSFSVFRCFIYLYFLFLHGFVSCAVLPTSEYLGLEYFFNSTNGTNWNWNAYGEIWNFTGNSDPCLDDWQGIMCGDNCTGFEGGECHILGISLADYSLVGPIPAEINLLSNLSYLSVSSNMLSGSLPSTFGDLSYLSSVVLEFNALGGTLPECLGNLQALENFVVYFNSFSGSISSYFGDLSELTYLDLGYNRFIGKLPVELEKLKNLAVFYSDGNNFSGKIPDIFADLTKLYIVQICFNKFTSTLPTSLSALSHASILSVNDNLLTGSLPASLRAMTELNMFDIADNFFSGNLNGFSSFSGYLDLLFLYFDHNLLSGQFPWVELVCSASNLKLISIGVNNFGGSISSCVSSISGLNYIDISNNFISGQLPSLELMANLTNVLLSHNVLSGKLTSVFGIVSSGSASNYLETIDISDNAFDGNLPMSLFSIGSDADNDGGEIIPKVKVFMVSKNCFSGTISAKICNAASLENLDLSGLNSGSGCSRGLHLFGLYLTSVSSFKGIIPHCLFALENITQLYISGNGIESDLPDYVSGNLRNISLSNNRIYGNLPYAFQVKTNFQVLDMSFNRITDTISDTKDYPFVKLDSVVPSVKLHGNRFSGIIPSNYLRAKSVDILSGNMFECRSSKNLPQNDPNADKYVCGSDELDGFFYTYFAIFGVVLLIGIVIALNFKVNFSLRGFLNCKLLVLVRRYILWHKRYSTGVQIVDNIASCMSEFRFSCFLLLGMILFIMLPTYLCFKATGASSYLFQYGWKPSLAFMEDLSAGVVIAVFWLLCLLFFIYSEFRRRVRDDIVSQSSAKSSNATIVSLVIALNVVIVLVVNSLYVYLIFTSSTAFQVFISLCLIIFKIVFNSRLIIVQLDRLGTKVYVILAVLIFNNVVAPMLASMALNIDCFQSVFIPATPIKTSYSIERCILYTFTNCDQFVPEIVTVTFSPPFIYSGLCSSAIMTTYVPVFIGIYGVIGLVIGIIQLYFLFYFADIYELRANLLLKEFKFLQATEPVLVRKLSLLRFLKGCGRIGQVLIGGLLPPIVFPIESKNDFLDDELSSRLEEKEKSEERIQYKNVYRGRSMGVNNVVILTILLTFGMSYPPLALILTLNLCLHTIIFQLGIHFHYSQIIQINILSLAEEATKQGKEIDESLSNILVNPLSTKNPAVVKRLEDCELLRHWTILAEKSYRDLKKILFGSRTFMLLFSVVYICLFIVDMLLDSSSVSVIVLIILLFMIVYSALFYVKKTSRYVQSQNGAEIVEVELVEIDSAGNISSDLGGIAINPILVI